MTHIHHTLSEEFPEHLDRLHKLKQDDAHFVRLHDDYDRVNEEINKIEARLESTSDNYLEELKKQRLLLKDRISAIIQAPV